jgi:hypothetical protein
MRQYDDHRCQVRKVLEGDGCGLFPRHLSWKRKTSVRVRRFRNKRQKRLPHKEANCRLMNGDVTLFPAAGQCLSDLSTEQNTKIDFRIWQQERPSLIIKRCVCVSTSYTVFSKKLLRLKYAILKKCRKWRKTCEEDKSQINLTEVLNYKVISDIFWPTAINNSWYYYSLIQTAKPTASIFNQTTAEQVSSAE